MKIGGNTWVRVHGGVPDRPKVTNRDFITNSKFIKDCESAGIPVTTRQASKYRRKLGLAYNS